ncbi:hypothetical protein [Borrelia venezuelensis]|uniref:hypothetical protein n=1 Tax=Borrelia venezuelensis TaxID=1653839 RepID=UPI001FF5DF6D|nr:hypothetical protein [Borrelia venezuelensis]UPA12616.1 hypothetical protein bvRMA01_000948 [Borrelia venezuelensis]
MTKVCVVIFVMISLGFLIVECTVSMEMGESIGIVGQRGPRGITGLAGNAGLRGDVGDEVGRGDIAILMTSLSKLKRSYYANINEFNLQKNDIDTKALFDHSIFEDLFKLNNPENGRDDVYASLKHNVEDIQTVKRIIESLTNSSDSIVKEYAKYLLSFLKDSARFIREIISFLDKELVTLKQSNDLEGMSELNSMLIMMFRQRESVLDDIHDVLRNAKQSFKPNFVDTVQMRDALGSIVRPGERLREKVYGGHFSINRSLQSLLLAITEKVNQLKRSLVS